MLPLRRSLTDVLQLRRWFGVVVDLRVETSPTRWDRKKGRGQCQAARATFRVYFLYFSSVSHQSVQPGSLRARRRRDFWESAPISHGGYILTSPPPSIPKSLCGGGGRSRLCMFTVRFVFARKKNGRGRNWRQPMVLLQGFNISSDGSSEQ